MPKTTVNKDGHMLHNKDEVGPSGKVLMTPPASNFAGTKEPGKKEFGCFVFATAYAGHYGRSLCLGKYVCHIR